MVIPYDGAFFQGANSVVGRAYAEVQLKHFGDNDEDASSKFFKALGFSSTALKFSIDQSDYKEPFSRGSDNLLLILGSIAAAIGFIVVLLGIKVCVSNPQSGSPAKSIVPCCRSRNRKLKSN